MRVEDILKRELYLYENKCNLSQQHVIVYGLLFTGRLGGLRIQKHSNLGRPGTVCLLLESHSQHMLNICILWLHWSLLL